MKGYIWKITSNKGGNWRISTEGFLIDEAISEFRRVYGYESVVYSIVYFSELGEFND